MENGDKMNRIIAAVTITASMSLSTSVFAHTWDLVKDVQRTSNQISFAQGARGVWYFMESNALKQDPTIYRQMPDYNAPCINVSGELLTNGVAYWQVAHSVDNNPRVGVNFTNQTKLVFGQPVPAHVLWLHPAPDRYSIVAWKSPISGSVNINGVFSDLAVGCGNGVRWMIDRNTDNIQSSVLPEGGEQQFHVAGLKVMQGTVLYFTVDPLRGDNCADWTALTLTIRVESLGGQNIDEADDGDTPTR